MFNLEEVRILLTNRDTLDLDCLFMSKQYEFKKVLLDNDLKNELINALIDKFFLITNAKTVENYDPIVRLEDKIPSLAVSDVTNLEEVKHIFNNIQAINPITSIEETKESKAYVIILKNDDNKIIFYKKYSSSNYLKSRLKILFRDGRLEKLDKDILSIDEKFDCAIYGDYIAIFSQHSFEQIFNYIDEYTRKATDNISIIQELNLIENLGLMQEDCNKVTIKKKISKISLKDIEWFENKMKNDIDRIRLVINEANLDMSIEDDKLIFNDTSELIHLIQNDYLTSKISEENFVADKKTKIVAR